MDAATRTPSVWRSALWRWAPVLAVGAAALAGGPPEGVTQRGWSTAAVFAATIVGFITRPVAMGPMVLVGLVVLLLAGAFGTGKDAVTALLAGFGDATVWLVAAAFLLSGAVVRTGFGKRVALGIIKQFGGTTLGLGYSLMGAELCLGPVIPSNTARGGGVMAPIVNSLALAMGSTPDGPRRGAGAFLVLCGAHANLIAAAMYLTGMAANPELGRMAREQFQIRWDWLTWLQGSWLPALVSMATLPWLLYRLCPPEVTDGRLAQEEAVAELRAMGPWTPRQLGLAAVLVGMVVAWAAEPWHGVHSTGIALIGLAAILVLGIDRWGDMAGDRGAWDALVWLGGLVTMAERLRTEGVVDWFAQRVAENLAGFTGATAAVMLALVYFFSMYGFSMLTGHIMAMGGVFFVVADAAGAPPLLIVALLSYFSNLCGCLTNYSTGPVVIYFGLGYVSAARWCAIGLAVGLFHLAVWLGLGLPYWKWLGWW
jgi:DASS family divalent anion:Na+ symporter